VSRWDISPEGVRTVLGRTENVATELERHVTGVNEAIDGVLVNVSSDLVATAVDDFVARSAAPAVKAAFARINACLAAAGQATNAYVAGDLEMAGNAQAAAAAAPDATMGARREAAP
jgi:Family of unknown function (DUF6507)